ncbi:hypothetical protein LOTGIDRAFT_159033 [Lottia gigantea]|uniref:Uncharacterized protein n=1 Tax=Lottia gigantea TaxID=225164 RepID=V4A301_LOTGI|nr:hypothetical protein LOTGIDRAFT_159033 [Lottia gigantea]ESO98238.1 hypothetical protein LOTGIDRAFT_159033 [Lottia gigantea]
MSSKQKSKRYYIRGNIVPFEEDASHEFKGHRNLCVEELPPWTQVNSRTEKASRKAVSRAINGFLNTGNGGMIYLGIIDCGKSIGLKLTHYQKDHVVGSLQDLMSRYNPPVLSHRYKVRFIPVIDKGCTPSQIAQQCNYDSSLMVDQCGRTREHMYRTHHYCWCDNDCMAQTNCGVLVADYVIEITIKGWDPSDSRNKDGVGSILNLHPIHENEEGSVYFRRQASLVKYTPADIVQVTRKQVQDGCKTEIERLRKEIRKAVALKEC